MFTDFISTFVDLKRSRRHLDMDEEPQSKRKRSFVSCGDDEEDDGSQPRKCRLLAEQSGGCRV
jgi:hypothetical protein